MPEQFVITKDLAEKIANYLTTRPWAEVNELIVGITKLEPLKGPDGKGNDKLDAAK